MSKIAIIGSGLAGLTLAHQLQPYADIHLFEKAQRAGGRLASRTAGLFQFDHGAQFFTVKTPRFAEFIQPLIKKQVIERWDAHFAEFAGAEKVVERQWNADYPHFVGSPDMQAFAQALAAPLDIQFNQQITHLMQQNGKWCLLHQRTQIADDFDWVISCLPASQTADLLPKEFASHHSIEHTKMLACYALMLGFNDAPALDWQAALVRDAKISWMSVNSSKPSRSGEFSMVIQANNIWAEENLAVEDERIKQQMLDEIQRVSGLDTGKVSHIDLKRWVFANIPAQTGQQFYLDNTLKLAACGDWCIQGRVESAFSSAEALGQQLILQLS
jgi:renalase